MAAVLLRFALSAVLFKIAYQLIEKYQGKTKKDRPLGVLVGVLGFLFLAGLWIQPAGLTTAAAALVGQKINWPKRHPLRLTNEFYLLIVSAALSLVFLGAGFWAIDLPL
jgi:hypothetical protein